MAASLPRHDRLNPWPLAAELSLQFRSAPQRSGVEVEMNPPPNDEAGSAGRQPRAPGLPAVMPSSDHDAPQPPHPTGSPEGSGAGNGDKDHVYIPRYKSERHNIYGPVIRHSRFQRYIVLMTTVNMSVCHLRTQPEMNESDARECAQSRLGVSQPRYEVPRSVTDQVPFHQGSL